VKKFYCFMFLLVVAVTFTGCGGNISSHRQEYISALEEFRNLALSVGTEAESVSGLVHSVWNDAIRENLSEETMIFTIQLRDGNWEDVWDFENGEPIYPATASSIVRMIVPTQWNDFNTALSLMRSNPVIIERRANIEYERRNVSSVYLQLSRAPEGLERAEIAASAMFEALDMLISLATNPTGNLNSYSENRREAIDEFMRNYRLLGDVIETFSD
jgi:hypothetical protein